MTTEIQCVKVSSSDSIKSANFPIADVLWLITTIDDGVIVDGNIYCFAGKDTWKSLVDSGKLTCDDAKSPNLKSADWMKDLFAIFQHASAGHKHLARRLAAW